MLYISTLSYAAELPVQPLPEIRYQYGSHPRAVLMFARPQPGRRWEVALRGGDDAPLLNRLSLGDILDSGPSAAVRTLASKMPLSEPASLALEQNVQCYPQGFAVVRDHLGPIHIWVVACECWSDQSSASREFSWTPVEEFELAAFQHRQIPLAQAVVRAVRSMSPS